MLLNPLHHHSLVEQSDIQVAIGSDSFTGEKPIQPNPIVEIHKDHVTASGLDQVRAVPIGVAILSVSCKRK